LDPPQQAIFLLNKGERKKALNNFSRQAGRMLVPQEKPNPESHSALLKALLEPASKQAQFSESTSRAEKVHKGAVFWACGLHPVKSRGSCFLNRLSETFLGKRPVKRKRFFYFLGFLPAALLGKKPVFLFPELPVDFAYLNGLCFCL